MSALLPLFPLDLVLLPRVPLPLHIFEPRYKEMIKECLEQSKPFGIVRAREKEKQEDEEKESAQEINEGFASVGCTAEILNVLKAYPDGRLNILAEGQKRFEVLQINQERTFLQAEVFYLQDEDELPTAADMETAIRLHGEIMALAGAHPEQLEQADKAQLAYRLAGSLPFDPDFQQALLEMNSEAVRIREVISFFERILPVLHRSASAKQRAGGNGHVN